MTIRSNATARRARRGIALVLCTLAATLVGIVGMGLLTSQQRQASRVAGVTTYEQARQLAIGAAHQGLAELRARRTLRGRLALPIGPERSIGGTTQVVVSQRGSMLDIDATAQVSGAVSTYRITVNPSRL
jgi:type II secretory pathway component PulK